MNTTITTKNLGTTIREIIADTVGGTIADSHERSDDKGAVANYVVDLGHVAGITEQGNRLTLEVRTSARDGSVQGEVRPRILTELYEWPEFRKDGKVNADVLRDVEVLRPFENIANISIEEDGLNLSTGRLEPNTVAFQQDVVALATRIFQITL